MFLKHKESGDLVEILEMDDLYDPNQQDLKGRFHAGEEMQEPENFAKTDLIFPSDEPLPVCWLDANYKEN